MKHEIIFKGQNDEYSIIFQSTTIGEDGPVVVASDVRGILTKEAAIEALETALVFIKEN